MDAIWTFLNSPAGLRLALCASVIWLTAVVMWPEATDRLTRLTGYEPKQKPKPSEERLGEVENYLGNVNKQIAELERLRIDIADGQNERLTELERHTDAIAGVMQKMPGFSRFVVEIKALCDEAETCIDGFQLIRAIYPKSEPAMKPFAKYWNPTDGDAAKAGFIWAKRLEGHVEHVRAFARVSGGIDISAMEASDLFKCVTSWGEKTFDVSAQECQMLLFQQHRALTEIDRVHAANFPDPTLKPIGS